MKQATRQGIDATSINPALLVGLIAAFLAISGLDYMEIIPGFSHVTASQPFKILHSIHDVVAVALGVFVAWKMPPKLGAWLIVLFMVTHAPYFYLEVPRDFPELAHVLITAALGLASIALIAERRRAYDLFQQIGAASPIGIYVVQGGKFRYVNPQFQKIVGYIESELRHRSPLELVHAEDAGRVRETAVAMLKGKASQPYEFKVITKGEGAKWILETVTSVQYRGQRATLGNFMDITERKQDEETLRRSEKRYRSLFDNMLEGFAYCQMLVKDNRPDDFVYLEVNDAFEKLTGLKDVVGRKVTEVIPGIKESNPELFEIYGRVAATGLPEVFETYVEPLQIWFSISVYGPAKGYFIATFDNITERKRVERKLQESEAQYRNLSDSLNEVIYRADPETLATTFVNRAVEKLYGYTVEEWLENPASWENTIHPDDKGKVFAVFAEFQIKKEPRVLEYRIVRKDKTSLWVRDHMSWEKDRQGNASSISGVVYDITERRKMEEKLKGAAEEWRTTFDSVTDLVSVIDKNFKLVRVNKAFADAYGKKPEELIGRHCYQVAHEPNEPVPGCPYKKTLLTRKPATAEYFEPKLEIYLEETTSPIFNGKGEPVGSVQVARDITERRRMQEQLMLSGRLASIGELASGVAHELNNPLTSVIGFSQLLMEREIPDDIKEDLGLVCSEAQRAAGIIKNLLTFARKHAPVRQLCQIHNVIDDVLKLRAYEQKVNNIEVNRQFAPDLPEVMVDYSQMQQVFLNIIANAEYFMSEAHGRGTLTISTRRLNNTLRVSFADDGPGIAPENLNQVFNPFFTTKAVGKGTGLGLSVSHGIVSEHGGSINARSQLGEGATFVVELPLTVTG